ncbi:Cyclin-dependent kinase catalytic subunit [Gamsiella multidivaricata]|nr:Cyclin-dependent kinase catalytic subunit [Gamsiella multidivaricata]
MRKLLGDSEIDELFKIFNLRGTPSESIWPGVEGLKDWKSTFPDWKPKPLRQIVPQLSKDGINLLSQMLEYDPAKRISAKRALLHPFFDDIRSTVPAFSHQPRVTMRRC